MSLDGDSHCKGRLHTYLSHRRAWQVTQTPGNHPSFTNQTAQRFGQKTESFHPWPDPAVAKIFVGSKHFGSQAELMAAEGSGAVNKNRKAALMGRVRIRGCIWEDVTILSWDPWCPAHVPVEQPVYRKV